MLDLNLSMYVLPLGVSLVASYALIMSLHQKEINLLWTRGEAAIAVLALGVALSFGYMYLIGGSLLFKISIILLLLALAISAALVVYHRFVLKHQCDYPVEHTQYIKYVAYTLFAINCLHVFTLFAAIAGF